MSEKWEEGDCLILDEDELIAHVVGSSCDRKGKSWKRFWEEHSGRMWPARCQTHNCGNAAAVGAHVHVKGVQTRNKFYFILPTCQSCNMAPENNWTRHTTVGWESVKQRALVVAAEYNPCAYAR
eukprot:TRINITY_DN9901_c0_g1_i1.p1 TRINITY_DN9901_c0_g1~~TRINITY_DN9901_c0_g1_i1.p1  ORF type:complete len:124 (+),score=9.99 TRINITY_DN9901_c0_g1_i1:52-423(+)